MLKQLTTEYHVNTKWPKLFELNRRRGKSLLLS